MVEWFNGANRAFIFTDIIADIKNHAEKKGTVFIGTDSQIIKSECIFSTAICLHGADNQEGGKYYIRKIKFNANKVRCTIKSVTSSTVLNFK